MCKIQGKTVCTCGLGEVGSSSSRSSLCVGAWGSTSTIPGGGTDKDPDALPLDAASPVTFDPAAPPPVTQAPPPTRDPAVATAQPRPSPPDPRTQESVKEAHHGEAQHDTSTSASRHDLHLPGLHRKRKEHGDGKEGGEHDPKVIRSNKEVVGDLDSIRPKVPAYAKDSGSQSQSAEEEKTPSYLSTLTSDDEPTRYEPVPTDVTPCHLGLGATQQRPSSGLSELVNANEPVPSDRGSWGMRDTAHSDSWHRTAPRYSRFDDDSAVQTSWYRSDDDDIMLSPRASQAFTDTGAPPGRDDHTPPPGQSAVKILMKNINSIKKKIKRYEEEFEAAFGYRPSHSEKMKHKEIKKYMSELSKARKELKQMKDDVAGMMSVPTVFPLSLLRCQESTNPGARPTASSSGTVDTLRHVEDRLREKRSALGRPADLKNMNCTEMQEEKTALQKALLYYESVHGRPTTREDRDLARPLYDRYRQVKRIVMRSSSRAKENLAELPPIIEHVAMDFTLASPQHRSSLHGDEVEKLLPAAPTTPPGFDSLPVFDPPQSPMTQTDDPKDGQRSVALGDLHALPLGELRERKKEAREEKKKLRRSLREYEEKFEREMGRKVQKEDRGPMEQTYLDYKHAKAKLRLLEALLSKHEPHKV
ncbi:protein FAM13A-like isoform X6 [Homarus americanus]|uniref:protein FAM13A-like isoform X6 n=1 Tax=Homarus americanus TaxID=6706 RepID=UPI001C481203|nr:protein FAM13A-like isoform X6 [Homarus americanus]